MPRIYTQPRPSAWVDNAPGWTGRMAAFGTTASIQTRSRGAAFWRTPDHADAPVIGQVMPEAVEKRGVRGRQHAVFRRQRGGDANQHSGACGLMAAIRS